MSHIEYYKDYRVDGRAADELRNVEFASSILGYKNFSGSARTRHGLTEVTVYIDGPREVLS